MAWVPFIVASRRNRYYRTRGSGIIAALVIFFLLFGVLFFIFFNRMNVVTIPLWIMISSFGGLLLIIGIIMAIVASTSQTYKKSNETHLNRYQSQPQKQPYQTNPYIISNPSQKQLEDPQDNLFKRDIPIISDINYCRYCGTKIEGDAAFCHQCGTKLS